MKVFRTKFKFNHSSLPTPLMIKAYSEESAWKKLRNKIVSAVAYKQSGGLWYSIDYEALERLTKEFTCERAN